MPWKFQALSDVRRHACQLEKFLLLFERGCLNFFQENAWKTAGKLWSRPHVRFCLKKDFFPPVWPAVYTYPVKTVTENVCFQERSPKERFLTTPLCCTRVDGWKRRFMKTMTSRWWIPVNAHAFVKMENTISVFKQTRIREDGALVESDTFLR